MSLDEPRGTDAVVRRLVEILRAPTEEAPRVEPLEPAPAPRRVVAVDGSSVVLAEAGERFLAAYRSGRVGLQNGAALPARVPPPEVVLLASAEAQRTVLARLEALGLPPQTPLPRIDAKGALDALRTLAEMEQALEALDELERGDLLLLDGALQSRALVPLLDRVVAKAEARGVDLVGVCKSTSLTLGGVPALVACQLAARGARTWTAPLPTKPQVRGRSLAARLSPAEPRPFRFDVVSARDPRDVLASVAALCGHPAYPGYPSPLAMAHNAVLLNEEARRRLYASVHDAALKAGVDADAWDAAFVDYHDILELGA